MYRRILQCLLLMLFDFWNNQYKKLTTIVGGTSGRNIPSNNKPNVSLKSTHTHTQIKTKDLIGRCLTNVSYLQFLSQSCSSCFYYVFWERTACLLIALSSQPYICIFLVIFLGHFAEWFLTSVPRKRSNRSVVSGGAYQSIRLKVYAKWYSC